jgi:hypothetical protein
MFGALNEYVKLLRGAPADMAIWRRTLLNKLC